MRTCWASFAPDDYAYLFFVVRVCATFLKPETRWCLLVTSSLATKCASFYRLLSCSFGYSLDSQLLCDIAQAGAGLYNFIPDASMVGTVFVNFVAMVLASLSARTLVELMPHEGSIDKVVRVGTKARARAYTIEYLT